jgi:tetratricopeptide (TPR) repeat protein
VLQNLSLIEGNRGRLDRAAVHLEEALRLQPGNPTLLGMLIQVRQDQGRSEGLIELYRRLIAVQPQNALAYAELGLLLEEQGQPEAAERAFLKAESLDTEEPYPYLYLARLSRRRGEETNRILSRLHSAIGKAVRKSGMLQMQAAGAIGETEGALESEQIETLRRLSEQAEQPRRILREALSLLAETHGSRDAYARDVERLSEWYPHSPELRIAAGRALEEQGRLEEARRYWLGVLDDMPTAAGAHLGLARSLEQLGRLEEARVAYRRARDLDPENPDIYAALLRLAGSDLEELLQWYEELYSRERTNVVLLDSWADLEERLGYAEQAAKHRLRARALEQRE